MTILTAHSTEIDLGFQRKQKTSVTDIITEKSSQKGQRRIKKDKSFEKKSWKPLEPWF